MHATRLMPLVLLGAFLLTSAAAHAQPLFGRAYSIEATVANADLVFIAKLEKYGDAEKIGGREVHQATIAIEETLKQDLFTIEPYTRLSIQIPAPAAVLADWVKSSPRLLVAHDSDAPTATTVFELTDGKLQTFTADMKLLRKPDDLIHAAREAVRTAPTGVRRIHTFGLAVPRELIAGTEWEKVYQTGGHLILHVPVDKQLEKRAQEYLASENSRTRGEGARALRYFKSDENIARIKTLLNDPARALRHHAPPKQGREAIYVVRHDAYETLMAWKVDVKKPVILEDVQE